jgi:squalene-hopene/tetraprenyl-beta-curcumene cyclase
MRGLPTVVVVSMCVGFGAFGLARQDGAANADGWDRAGAAEYLDERMEIWLAEGKPLRTGDDTTNCSSCHTTVPYALARPVLRRANGAEAQTSQERRLVEQVIERVESYGNHELMYEFNEAKQVESRGTEAVLNALILVNADAYGDHGMITVATRAALEQLWKTQRPDGAWEWLDFGLEPFETTEATYHGAALAALAIGTAGAGITSHQSEAAAAIDKLRGYLKSTYAARSLFNRMYVLLASGRFPGLLTTVEREALMEQLQHRQQDDGGWSLSALGEWRWSRSEAPFDSPGTLDDALLARSDGYATGLVVHALREAGVSTTHAMVRRGLDWLRSNQQSIAVNDRAPAAWRAYSLNFDREHGGEKGEVVRRLFMSDLATGFAVLALSGAD